MVFKYILKFRDNDAPPRLKNLKRTEDPSSRCFEDIGAQGPSRSYVSPISISGIVAINIKRPSWWRREKDESRANTGNGKNVRKPQRRINEAAHCEMGLLATQPFSSSHSLLNGGVAS